MIKIEVTVVESKHDSCTITVKKPKQYKKSTEAEVKTANVIKNSIDNCLGKLSKGDI